MRSSNALKYARHEREAAEKRVDAERSRYIPAVTLSALIDVSASDRRTLSDYAQRKTGDYYLAVDKLNSWGGVSSLGFLSQKEDLTLLASGGSSQFSAQTFLRYDQPLLKGFGPAVNNIDIDRATVSRQAVTGKSGSVKAKMLFEVYRSYFEFYAATKESELVGRIRGETEKICGMLAEKVNARHLPVTELKTMQASLLMLDKQLLDLQSRKRRERQKLLLLLNGRFPDRAAADPLPSTPPQRIMASHPLTEVTAGAQAVMENLDPELAEQRAGLRLLELERLKAENDLKPDLKLSLEVGVTGNDPHDRLGSIRDMSTDNYRAAVLGTLSFPVADTAARSRLAVVNSRIEQARIRILDRQNEIRKGIADLCADILSSAEKRELDARIVANARENLDNEIERLTRGKSTSLDTVQYQTKYIEAQRQMLATTIDHVLLIGSYYLFTQDMETLAAGS